MKKDNSTLRQKISLRKKALVFLDAPIIMETHGGFGAIYDECYRRFDSGVVFDKDPRKTAALAKQRPTWAVYECDSVAALSAGIGGHLPINFIDLDPYGEPWPVMDALFGGKRAWPDRLVIVVNDGLRQKLKVNGGWHVKSLVSVVQQYGNQTLYANYLDVCQELVKEKASQVGYTLTRWGGYYCGYLEQMTHYAAVLEHQ